jgi:hypothetical protein
VEFEIRVGDLFDGFICREAGEHYSALSGAEAPGQVGLPRGAGFGEGALESPEIPWAQARYARLAKGCVSQRRGEGRRRLEAGLGVKNGEGLARRIELGKAQGKGKHRRS